MSFISDIIETYELSGLRDAVTEILPKGYDTDSARISLSEVGKYPDKTQVTVHGYVDNFQSTPFGKKGLRRIKARLYKDGRSMVIYWITSGSKESGMMYSLKQKAPKEKLIQVTGKIASFMSRQKRVVMISSPKLSVSDMSGPDSNGGQGVVVEPMYVLRKKTTVFQIQELFRHILGEFDEIEKYLMPKELEKKLGVQGIKKSLMYLHGLRPIPADKISSFLNYDGFFKRIAIEKIYETILSSHKSFVDLKYPSISLDERDKEMLRKLSGEIPFLLTNDQKKAIWGMLSVFSKQSRTKNLLYGDVGSGKTVVALMVSRVLIEKGKQVALIAPSSILANQHYEDMKNFFPSVKVFLLHSKTKAKQRKEIKEYTATGKPCLVIGTTSVNNIEFENLGAVFIDEEQKFGVVAKELLYEKYNTHLIFMTATPIPRTLASSLFMNFHVFEVRQKPSGQKERITKIIDTEKDANIFNDVLNSIRQGEQALVIVPSIDSDELFSAEKAKEKYSKLITPKNKIIHGKMKKDEVDKIILEYMEGKYPLLISTTMVDAGFSNKNLCHVFIENPDRFGISQLHQIRGRVGRGEKQGYCYFVRPEEGLSKKAFERLSVLCSSEDGFFLSKKDLESRGSGDLSKNVQSGTEMNFMYYEKEIAVIKDYINEVK